MIDDDAAPAWVTVRAVIERPLPEADVFERALVGQTDPKTPKIAIGAASPGLKDTEQHRQRLLDVWAARVKALAKTTDDSTITLLNCSPPGDVRVTGGTLEKLGLTLPIACTIGVQPRSK